MMEEKEAPFHHWRRRGSLLGRTPCFYGIADAIIPLRRIFISLTLSD